MDCATSPPPIKRSRRCSHVSPELKGPHRRLDRPPNKGLSPKTPHGETENEQSLQTQSRERSSSEERSILSQHHNAALCVCWIWSHTQGGFWPRRWTNELMMCIVLTLNQVCHRPIPKCIILLQSPFFPFVNMSEIVNMLFLYIFFAPTLCLSFDLPCLRYRVSYF